MSTQEDPDVWRTLVALAVIDGHLTTGLRLAELLMHACIATTMDVVHEALQALERNHELGSPIMRRIEAARAGPPQLLEECRIASENWANATAGLERTRKLVDSMRAS